MAPVQTPARLLRGRRKAGRSPGRRMSQGGFRNPSDRPADRRSLMRSLLFVPGDDERKLATALESEADALIVDLEESVAAAAKPAARAKAAAFLARERARAPRARLYVRINPIGGGLAETDLAAVTPAAPDGIVLPKCHGGAECSGSPPSSRCARPSTASQTA